MFLPIPFDSENAQGDLPPGEYVSMLKVFGRERDRPDLFFIEFRPLGIDSVMAIDLLAFDADGDARVCDFVWMRDRCWRDSAGHRSNDLGALLPPELMGLTLLDSRDLGSVFVEQAE